MPFIVVEGPDGAGKTTQTALLVQAMQAAGLPVTAAREPGGTALGNLIRPLLVEHTYPNLTVGQELVLFNASRISFIHEVLAPVLARNEWFVADRYAHSTLAYQVAGGLPEELVETVVNATVGNTWPDLTLLLDVDAETGLTRSTKLRDNKETRFEDKGETFHHKVVSNYRKLAGRAGTATINAREDIAAVHHAIIGAVNGAFNLSLQPQAAAQAS